MPTWKPPALDIPQEPKTSYSLTQSGTFHEGDFSIGRAGLIIGSKQQQQDRTHDAAAVSPGHAGMFGSALPDMAEEEPPDEEEQQLRALQLEDLEDHGAVGAGTSGVVNKVVHIPTGRTLALKVMQFDVSNDTVRKQITAELRTLYDSHHTFIVRYYQAYFEGGCIIVIMEFMDGGTLAHLLQRLRVIEEPYLAVLARQALAGLNYLHRDLRVIHRDIKPSNLLLSTSGTLKISDFGVSGHLDSSVSQAASWVGTVTYMSPERIRGAPYGVSSDIWSLGLTLLEAALGRFPYPATESPNAATGLGFWDLLAHIVEQPVPVPPPGPTMSPQLADFLTQALAKDPVQRPSAAELLQHPFLQPAADGSPPADLAQLVARAAKARSRPASQDGPLGAAVNALPDSAALVPPLPGFGW